MCDITRSYLSHSYVKHDSSVWRGSFICVAWLPQGRAIVGAVYVWRDSFVCETFHIWDMTSLCDVVYLYLWHDYTAGEKLLDRGGEKYAHVEWGMSYMRISHVWHNRESFHIQEWVMSNIQMCVVIHTKQSCQTKQWVMSYMRMSTVIYTNESCDTYEWVMSYIQNSHVK